MTKQSLRLILLACLLTITTACHACTSTADSVKVLWIGNSYTMYNDLPAMVKEIAATQDIDIANTTVLKGAND